MGTEHYLVDEEAKVVLDLHKCYWLAGEVGMGNTPSAEDIEGLRTATGRVTGDWIADVLVAFLAKWPNAKLWSEYRWECCEPWWDYGATNGPQIVEGWTCLTPFKGSEDAPMWMPWGD